MTFRSAWLPALAVWLAASPPAPWRAPSLPGEAAAQAVALRTDDGVSLAATYLTPRPAPGPAVVLVHMQTRTRADWANLVEALADAGIGTLAVDLRGHGASASGPGGPGAPDNMSASVADVKAARVFLAARPEVAPGRVGMAGASVGANLALAAAAADSTVRAVVLLSAGIDYRGVRGDAAFRKYGKRPALLVASLEDSYATRSARTLGRLDEAAYEVHLLNGAGHGTVMLASQPDLVGTIVDWFRRTLL